MDEFDATIEQWERYGHLEDDDTEDTMFPDHTDTHDRYCSCHECRQSYEQEESERRHFYGTDRW